MAKQDRKSIRESLGKALEPPRRQAPKDNLDKLLDEYDDGQPISPRFQPSQNLTGSTLNPVENRPGDNLTRSDSNLVEIQPINYNPDQTADQIQLTQSELNPVENKPGYLNPVENRPGQKTARSKTDPVNTKPGQISTGSNSGLVKFYKTPNFIDDELMP